MGGSLPFVDNHSALTRVALSIFCHFAATRLSRWTIFSSFQVQCSLHLSIMGPGLGLAFFHFFPHLFDYPGLCAAPRLFNGLSDYPSGRFIKSLSGRRNLGPGYPPSIFLENSSNCPQMIFPSNFLLQLNVGNS